MKCPMCNGSGKCYEQKIRYQEIETNRTDFTLAKCHKCNGTGEVQMTNEEYLKSCNTEQLAKFIFWQHFDVYGKTLYELMVNASRGVSRDKQAEVMIGAVVEWLKEKHE